jgi:spore coat polysaccharide biosynthesis protein SpsF
MSKTIAIVQARLGSRRLKGKIARRLGGHSLLEHVVRRVTDCELLDGVVVAAADTPDDAAIADISPPDVPIFVGDELDVLGRFVAAIDEYQADGVVRVCADNPFIDPVLIERLVVSAQQHPEADYISFGGRDGRPAILSAVGVFAEWCRADALRQADLEATLPADREHVTRYLYTHPEKFNLRLLPIPAELDCDDLRLTVDLEDDWEVAQTIFDALGPDQLEWQKITELLANHPRLREKMARLNRQHAKV